MPGLLDAARLPFNVSSDSNSQSTIWPTTKTQRTKLFRDVRQQFCRSLAALARSRGVAAAATSSQAVWICPDGAECLATAFRNFWDDAEYPAPLIVRLVLAPRVTVRIAGEIRAALHLKAVVWHGCYDIEYAVHCMPDEVDSVVAGLAEFSKTGMHSGEIWTPQASKAAEEYEAAERSRRAKTRALAGGAA